MSGVLAPEISAKIGVFRRIHARSFASVHGVSVVTLWSVLGRCTDVIGRTRHPLLTAAREHEYAPQLTRPLLAPFVEIAPRDQRSHFAVGDPALEHPEAAVGMNVANAIGAERFARMLDPVCDQVG